MATPAHGFDEEFVEPLSTRFTCPICHLAFREPVLTRCGHQFCSSCLTPCLQQSASCPVCRIELDSSSIFPNNALKREILDFNIKCCLHEKGCAWTGELRNGEIHDRECQYVNVVCENECEQFIMKKDIDDHMTNHCPQRIVTCKHCTEDVKQVELEDHYEECDGYPIDCTYKCGVMVQRCQMEDHIGRQGTCPNSLLDCDFEDNGCQFRGNRHNLCKHIENNIGLHFSLIGSALKETKEELRATKEELTETRDELTETREQLEETKDELTETRDELMETRGKLTESRVQLSEEIHRRSLSLLPQTPKQFLFTWTIDNWQEKLKASREEESDMEMIKSSSFYVYPGYHLYIGAYPNGDKADHRGNLSVFLFAARGDFDTKVSWPFPYSFDFELVDQQVGGMNTCRKVSPPYGNALKFLSNEGYGYPKFMSHRKLESRCYIKDDAICIKLYVDLTK
ncbi:TNF receptor-associated factor 6-like [Corticium candelabrum]|uniref:TNF receptor-associated factor 6-like n=1 Tax=Corticium candelabrum TaxID=121492 RepID=UPI002E26238E|nr:TNF receptor-associated factor 6-like [Corticium candelabrum]